MENKPEIKTYSVTLPRGGYPGYGSEWWTEEQWDEWRKREEELKASGEYGKLDTFTFSFVSVPEFDHPELFDGGCKMAIMIPSNGKPEESVSIKFEPNKNNIQ